jgi:anti-anti-sigma factor
VSDNGILLERAAHGVVVVVLSGEHDISTAGELEERLGSAVDAGSGVAVDLLGTTFIDSSVLRVLICARQRADERGVGFRVALSDSTGHGVRRLLDLTGMEERLAPAPTRAEAVAGAAAGVSPNGPAPAG